jgi:hypothetical protein
MTRTKQVKELFCELTGGDGDIERLRGPSRAADRQKLVRLYFNNPGITKSNSGINRLYDIMPAVYGIDKKAHCSAEVRSLMMAAVKREQLEKVALSPLKKYYGISERDLTKGGR